MTDETPTCDQCGTELSHVVTFTLRGWFCLGPCTRERVVWRTWASGKPHTDYHCDRLAGATNTVTQRDAKMHSESEYCRYCLGEINHTNQAEYATLAKRMRAADNPEEVKREFFGGEAQP